MTTATRPKPSKQKNGNQKGGKQQHAASSRRSLILVLGVVAVVVGLAAVFALTGGDDDSSAPVDDDTAALSQTNDVQIDGDVLPPFLDDTETAVGAAAPQATGASFDGTAVTVLEPGVPTVIGFFAHWCPHCQAEVDELSKYLAETGLPDDVNVVAVSTSVDSTQTNYPPSAWFESEGWPGTVLADDATSSLAQAYGLSAFPFWAVVDADGDLITRSSGGIGADDFADYLQMARDGS